MEIERRLDDALMRYAAFYKRISPATVGEITRLVTEDVRFADPFNDVRGSKEMLRVLEKMFADADEVSFTILNHARNETAAFLYWRCRLVLRRSKRTLSFDGLSKLSLDDNGLVTEHLDFWDAGQHVYEKIPAIGWLIRQIRKKLRA